MFCSKTTTADIPRAERTFRKPAIAFTLTIFTGATRQILLLGSLRRHDYKASNTEVLRRPPVDVRNADKVD